MHSVQMRDREPSDLNAHAPVNRASDAAWSYRSAGVAAESADVPEANPHPQMPVRDAEDLGDGWDDVYDASIDSFPASDPPPWMSMRIGGPSRRPAEPAVSPSAARNASKAFASGRRTFDDRWVAQHWPGVRIAHAEATLNAQYWRGSRPVLRAVVHVGPLTPADVRVTARYRLVGAEGAIAEPLRLWSVAALNKEVVIFESGALDEALDRVSEFTVVVEPVCATSDGRALRPVAHRVPPR